MDASLYHRLAIERGWPKERFRAWLQAAFEAQLLRPDRRQPASTPSR
jgi:hypothetical protein